MNVKINLNLKTPEQIIKEKGLEPGGKVQLALADALVAYGDKRTPKQQGILPAVPDKHNGNIYTKKYKDKWSFTSLDDKEFIWIMQLKEVHALKIIHEHAVNLSRIGLTESDWLRRCGR